MTAKEICHRMKARFCSSSASEPGRGKGKWSKNIKYGSHLVKGKAKAKHRMEDYIVSEFKQVNKNELGLFAIFDGHGHLGHNVAHYLQDNLFDNILKEHDFLTDTKNAIERAYKKTDDEILDQASRLGEGGSTAVTAILINGQKLVIANVGDSRAVVCWHGRAIQLSIDHEPAKEYRAIQSRGGFVSIPTSPGGVPRVDGVLAISRAFGDKNLKIHISSEPDIAVEMIDTNTEFMILASDGIWKVMSNQDAVDSIRHIHDPQSAAKHLVEVALYRKSMDDISCVVVRFH